MGDELKDLKARIEKIEEALKQKAKDSVLMDYVDRRLKALAEATAKGLELSNPSAAQSIRRDFKN